MRFDQDPSEQANISGADFAFMCDEFKRLKAINFTLIDALESTMRALRYPETREDFMRAAAKCEEIVCAAIASATRGAA